MTRRSEWPKGTTLQKTALALPKSVWQAARVQAFKEGRTFQELVAEALQDYLRKVKKGGVDAK
jgi:hypothetical protein